ncbi:hypothetical protein A2911_01560 [Candidatus Nomurabacteria bacterium RIFCSPLOWO2_01_FULL_40_15]|uniref:Uncharacterized protein n=1 Tax=Candidatus Nomurabacteria bacterium RIFCSPLOWO2_01_FULL_40_15 TaxID=1801772 RepID=A0A1F6X9A1_9BACT|nr:MAG: hypothetical protein A2911_01560 [Candidatus Nomurabacteria bacterium RIFCSPLOWO2_01_FULL_40_15]
MKESKPDGAQIKISKIFLKQDNVFLKRIYNFSPDIKDSLEKIISELNLSFNSKYSVFLSGSYAFSARANNFIDIKKTSDIDIWIIFRNISITKKEHLTSFTSKVLDLNNFDMVMSSWDPDKRFSIKFTKEQTLYDLFLKKKSFLKVERYESLFNKKRKNVFYSMDNNKTFLVKESFVKNKYLWIWELLLFTERDKFIMSDLISFFIVGFFIQDDLSLYSLRRRFLTQIDVILQDISKAELRNLFQYFKKSLPASFIKLLT